MALMIIAVASVNPTSVGAQAGAFGEIFTTGVLAATGDCEAMWTDDGLGLVNNPALAALGSRWSAAGGYRRLYELEYLQRVWGLAKYHHHNWGVGLQFSRFGKEEFYTETEATISFGYRLRANLALGGEIRHLRLAYTQSMPSYDGQTAGIGLVYQPRPTLTFSGAIRHGLRQNSIPGYDLPRRYHLAAALELPGSIHLGAGWSKIADDRDVFGLGQKIQINQYLTFLSALYFDPARYSLGAQFNLKGQAIIYTYLSHADLGGTHYIEFTLTN